MTTDHPVGFRKRYLLRTPWFSVRLHSWVPQQSQRPHKHRWAWFIGIPLRGEFIERRYIRVPGTSHTRYDTAPDRGQGRDYAPVGEDRLIEMAKMIRRPWRPYLCRHNHIHSYVTHGTGPHVSLVILGPTRSLTSEVWDGETFH
jgi:hypothetical protein